MTIESPLRAVVIGCGRIGAGFSDPSVGTTLTHASAYVASPLTELVAVCDTNAEAARLSARRWGVPDYHTHVRELLSAAQPEVVSICTPDPTHAETAEQILCFPSVRGVLIEKPLALTVAEAERTVALARDRGVVLAVNYSRRWAEGIRQAGKVIRQGRLGTVQSVSGHYANGWLHNGTHWIDLARMLVGEVVSVRALRLRMIESLNDFSLDAELEFIGGAKGIVLGHQRPGLSFFEMDLVCENGRVRLSEGAETIDMYELLLSTMFNGFFQYARVSSTLGGLDQAMLNAVEDVSRRICCGGSPACTGADGVAALRIAESARLSEGILVRLTAGAA